MQNHRDNLIVLTMSSISFFVPINLCCQHSKSQIRDHKTNTTKYHHSKHNRIHHLELQDVKQARISPRPDLGANCPKVAKRKPRGVSFQGTIRPRLGLRGVVNEKSPQFITTGITVIYTSVFLIQQWGMRTICLLNFPNLDIWSGTSFLASTPLQVQKPHPMF